MSLWRRKRIFRDEKTKKTFKCPMCGSIGALVDSDTVENIITESVEKGFFNREIFSLCMDEKCEMAYFSADYGFIYLQDDIKIPLDFKEDSNIKYICYCKKITINDVENAVKNQNAISIKEIFRFYSPIIVEECKVKNPLGFCCVPDIKKKIDDLIK